jgi:hypothetical protein
MVGLLVSPTPVLAAGPPSGLDVNVVNPASSPVPVTLQGTGAVTGNVTVTNTPNVTVTNTPNVNVVSAPGLQTQLLLDQVFKSGDQMTIPVAAYKTIHIDFNLVSGGCAGSGAVLLVDETTHFLNRGAITDTQACDSNFTGTTITMPGQSLNVSLSDPSHPNDTWRVVVFGRAN